MGITNEKMMELGRMTRQVIGAPGWDIQGAIEVPKKDGSGKFLLFVAEEIDTGEVLEFYEREVVDIDPAIPSYTVIKTAMNAARARAKKRAEQKRV